MQSKQWHNHWNHQQPSTKFKEWTIYMGHRRPWIFLGIEKCGSKSRRPLWPWRAVSMIVCHGALLGDLGAAAGSGRSDEVRCDWIIVIDYYCRCFCWGGLTFLCKSELNTTVFWISGPSDSVASKRSTNGSVSKQFWFDRCFQIPRNYLTLCILQHWKDPVISRCPGPTVERRWWYSWWSCAKPGDLERATERDDFMAVLGPRKVCMDSSRNCFF